MKIQTIISLNKSTRELSVLFPNVTVRWGGGTLKCQKEWRALIKKFSTNDAAREALRQALIQHYDALSALADDEI